MSRDFSGLLNPEQLRAVECLQGPLLILAGAGSGKTRVITYRIARLLARGAAQSSILAMTFTNKAAREMAHRVRELAGKKLPRLIVSTFHAFGVRVLREDGEALGYRPSFSIYDESDRESLLKECARELGFGRDLDLYAVEIKSGNKLPIGKVYRDPLAVLVRVPISNFDRLQAAKDELHLFLWDQEKQAWVRADIHKDVLKYNPGEDFISFQVKDWPLLDREIAAGG